MGVVTVLDGFDFVSDHVVGPSALVFKKTGTLKAIVGKSADGSDIFRYELPEGVTTLTFRKEGDTVFMYKDYEK